MVALCHRCGANLSAEDLFCPNCGAPQVKFEPQTEEERLPATARPTRFPSIPQGISWKEAIRATLIAAAPTGILSAVSVLSWGCCLWVIGGAVIVIDLYRRRVPGSRLDTRHGFRIGALAGLIAACTSVAATAVWRVIERFGLHRGADIDRFYDMVIQQSAALMQSNPEAQAQWRTYTHFLLTPDGRAAYTLMNSATTSLGIVLFSALGGALGVRLFAARKGPSGGR